MKSGFTVLALVVVHMAAAAPTLPPAPIITNAPARIELKDQFDLPQRLSFPTTNITVLTIADHKGSEQIASWVAPVKARYDNRLALRGLADVSAVPAWLRGTVRKKFQQRQAYPVMLDWSGDAVKAFAAVNNCVNVLVLDPQGHILKRFTGEAKPGALAELYLLLDGALSGMPAAEPTK